MFISSFHYIRTISVLVSFLTLFACSDEQQETSFTDHIDLAQLYLKQGSFKSSIIEAKNALQMEPGNIAALTTMAEIFLKLGDGISLEKLSQRAISIEPENNDLKLLLAEAYLLQQKTNSLNELVLTIDPKKVTNVSQYEAVKAELFANEGKLKEARQWFLLAHSTDKENIRPMLGLARLSILEKNLNDVQKYTNLAEKAAPYDIDVLLWKSRYLMLKKQYPEAETVLSRAMIELDQYDTLTVNKYIAIDMLTKALVAQGKIQESFFYSNYLSKSRFGQMQSSFKQAIEFYSEGNLSNAEKAFEELLTQAPDHKPSGLLLGAINFDKGQYNQAEGYLDKFATHENSPVKSKKILALTKIQLGKYDEAEEIVLQTLKRHPEDKDLYGLAGYAQLLQKKTDQSIASLLKAISFDSKQALYHLNLAQAYLDKKHYDKSISSSDTALSLQPDSERARYFKVQAYSAQNNYKSALSTAKEWVNNKPKSSAALNTIAILELNRGNIALARNYFVKTTLLFPADFIANINLAKLDANTGKTDKAVDRLGALINSDPENLRALNALVSLSISDNNLDKATGYINQTIKNHPSTKNSRLVLAHLQFQARQYQETVRLADEIIKLDNKHVAAYLVKAKALHQMRKTDDSISTYKSVLEFDSNNLSTLTELAQLYFDTKDFNSALAYIQKSLRQDSGHIPALILQTYIAIEQKNRTIAEQNIDTIRTIQPNSYISYELEADHYMSYDKKQQALNSYHLAWNLSKNDRVARKLSNLYVQQDRAKEALDIWKELYETQPKNFTAGINYALLLSSQNQNKKSIHVLENMTTVFSGNAVVLNNLAHLYMQIDDKRALNTAKLALTASPDNPAIQDTLGWIYIKQHKDTQAGIPLLEQAYKKTRNQEIKLHLIEALSMAGRADEATQLQQQ